MNKGATSKGNPIPHNCTCEVCGYEMDVDLSYRGKLYTPMEVLDKMAEAAKDHKARIEELEAALLELENYARVKNMASRECDPDSVLDIVNQALKPS